MRRNPFSINIKPINLKPSDLYGTKSSTAKRTLGIRDKQILYHRAKGRCEACSRKIDFSEMHAGHKNPASKGGSATLRNSVCVCARCNKLQGTDSWTTFMKKMGKTNVRSVTSGKQRKIRRKSQKREPYNPLGIQPIKLPKIRI